MIVSELKKGDACGDGTGECSEGLACIIPPNINCKEKCRKKCLIEEKGEIILI